MRMLWVCSTAPWPLDTAMRQRTWNLLAPLARAHDLTVVTWSVPGAPPVDLAPLRAVADVVVLPPGPPARLTIARRARRKLRFWAGAEPPYVQAVLEERGLLADVGRRRLCDEVRRRHALAPYDLVVLAEEAMACVPLPDLGVPVVLHRLNVFSRAIADYIANTGKARVRWLVERPRWRAFDRHVMDGADLVFAPTPESAAAIRDLAPEHEPVPLVNGVDGRALATAPADGRDLVFVGWMRYMPNIEAVEWFARHCWPELRRRFPEARLRVVGRDPAPEVRRLRGDGIEVTGEVPDVVAACEGARVGVVPLRHGMGIKTKTLELMAMGLPVVATSVGAEGIAASPADGLVVADDAIAIVEAVTRLMADGDTASRLGRAARRHVERHHSWDPIAAEHLRHLEAVCTPSAAQVDR